jgi:cytochrome P450
MTADALELERNKVATFFTPATVDPPPHPLSGLTAFVAMRRNLLEMVDAELFDRPFRERRVFGKTYLSVCDPELMQAVLLDHADAFGKAESTQRIFGPAVGEGLLIVEGSHWRRQRRAAAPAFRHEMLRRLTPTFAAVAEEQAERLRALAASGPVDVEPEMERATLAVIMRTLMASFGGEADAQRLMHTLRDFLYGMTKPNLLDLWGAPDWIPAPGRGRARRRVEAMRAEARRALDRRRNSDADQGDLLGALLAARDPETGQGLSDEELVDNILTFIGAGHETTAVLMTWALGLIARAPEVQDRLLAEARDVLGEGPVTADALDRLRFHEQVLDEALRLFTPGPFILRQAKRDIDLGPVRARKGTEVWCHLYVLHRSPRLWEQPAAFDPDRFSAERSQGRHRFAFIPFGAGPRICIGARFAMMEAKTMLATFVRALAFEPTATAQPVPTFRFTVRPRGGMVLNLVQRPRADSSSLDRAAAPIPLL